MEVEILCLNCNTLKMANVVFLKDYDFASQPASANFSLSLHLCKHLSFRVVNKEGYNKITTQISMISGSIITLTYVSLFINNIELLFSCLLDNCKSSLCKCLVRCFAYF